MQPFRLTFLSLLVAAFLLEPAFAAAAAQGAVEVRAEPEIALAAGGQTSRPGRGRATRVLPVGLEAPTDAELAQIEPPRKGKPPQIGFARPVTALAAGIGALEWEAMDDG